MDVSADGRRIAAVHERHEGEGLPVSRARRDRRQTDRRCRRSRPAGTSTRSRAGRPTARASRSSPGNFPRMPWDGTELAVVDVASDGSVGASRAVAGGDHESIFQPAWAPDGSLTLRLRPHRLVEPLPGGTGRRADEPDPDLGRVRRADRGCSGTRRAGSCPTGGSSARMPRARRPPPGAARPGRPGSSWTWTCRTRPSRRPSASRGSGWRSSPAGRPRRCRWCPSTSRRARSRSCARTTSWSSTPGTCRCPNRSSSRPPTARPRSRATYPPTNPVAAAPDGERPPLLVHVHGGPTSEVWPEAGPRAAVLHEPRDRVRRRELPWQHRVRSERSARACTGRMGRRRRRRRRGGRPAPRSSGASPTPSAC